VSHANWHFFTCNIHPHIMLIKLCGGKWRLSDFRRNVYKTIEIKEAATICKNNMSEVWDLAFNNMYSKEYKCSKDNNVKHVVMWSTWITSIFTIYNQLFIDVVTVILHVVGFRERTECLLGKCVHNVFGTDNQGLNFHSR